MVLSDEEVLALVVVDKQVQVVSVIPNALASRFEFYRCDSNCPIHKGNGWHCIVSNSNLNKDVDASAILSGLDGALLLGRLWIEATNG